MNFGLHKPSIMHNIFKLIPIDPDIIIGVYYIWSLEIMLSAI